MIGGNSVAVHWIGVQSLVSLRSIGPKNACAIGLSNRRWCVGGFEFFVNMTHMGIDCTVADLEPDADFFLRESFS